MKKVEKIFVIGTHPFPKNRGIAAMCMVSIDILKKYFPNSTLMICSHILEQIAYKASLYDTKYKYFVI